MSTTFKVGNLSPATCKRALVRSMVVEIPGNGLKSVNVLRSLFCSISFCLAREGLVVVGRIGY